MTDPVERLAAAVDRLAVQVEDLSRHLTPVLVEADDVAAFAKTLMDADPFLSPQVARAFARAAAGTPRP